ncbi:MAG: adenine phosphoribosyltransferase [Gammaproteobacteria bacterium]|nr:adenine phosphoribosyltransferase [Gammaproteobacteria bacterium]
MDLKSLIRDIPDFPKPGIMFRDITTLLQDHQGLSYVIDHFANNFSEHQVDYIIAIESRGFILGAPLAYHLGAGFVPVRKSGKLPAKVHSVDYELEYGADSLEIHRDAIKPGSKVLVVDDVIATGGTAAATAKLLDQFDCELLGFAFIVELTALAGRDILPVAPVHSIVKY